jgi:hypothetical protein
MGILLMGAGWKMAFSLFPAKEIRNTQLVLGNVFAETARLSPAWTIRQFFISPSPKAVPQVKYTILRFNADGEAISDFESTELPSSVSGITPASSRLNRIQPHRTENE